MGLSYSTQDLRCVRWDFSLGHMDSLAGVHRLSSCGTQAPECTSSGVVVCGISCSAACGSLVPWRDQIHVPCLQSGFLTTGLPGKSWNRTCSYVGASCILKGNRNEEKKKGAKKKKELNGWCSNIGSLKKASCVHTGLEPQGAAPMVSSQEAKMTLVTTVTFPLLFPLHRDRQG